MGQASENGSLATTTIFELQQNPTTISPVLNPPSNIGVDCVKSTSRMLSIVPFKLTYNPSPPYLSGLILLEDNLKNCTCPSVFALFDTLIYIQKDKSIQPDLSCLLRIYYKLVISDWMFSRLRNNRVLNQRY